MRGVVEVEDGRAHEPGVLRAGEAQGLDQVIGTLVTRQLHPLVRAKIDRGLLQCAKLGDHAAFGVIATLVHHRAVQIDIAEAQIAQGAALIATGEMGIGNTTAASAITAAILQLPVAQVTGRGTGLNDEQLTHKVHVIEHALATNTPDAQNPLDVLMKVGGLEIAGLVGVILAAGARRIPVVIDGFIAGAAALVAAELSPHLSGYLIAGHTSVEQGHGYILKRLGLHPLLNLELRLGEGTGAALAMGIIEGALRTHREMLTFAEAGVSERTDEA